MKIRHVLRGRCNPDNADGIIRHCYQIAHAQLQSGHDVAVYGVESNSEVPEKIDRDGLTVHAFPKTRWPFSPHPALATHLAELDLDTEIVHFHMPHDPAGYAVSRLLKRLNVPYVIAPHAMWEPTALARNAVKKRAYKTLIDDRMVRGAHGVMATARSEIASIARYAPDTRAFAIRNAIDIESTVVDLQNAERYWAHIKTSDETLIYTFMGRLDPYQKGLDILLDAWGRSRSRGLDAKLVLMGPYWRGSREPLQSLVDEHQISDSVHFSGPLFGVDKYTALTGSDIFIQLSRYETTPYSIQEAMACRLPVLLSADTNLSGVAERYGAGWEVALGAEQAAEAILRVSELSDDDRISHGQAARRLVEERHSIQRAATRMVAAYESALTGSQFDHDD